MIKIDVDSSLESDYFQLVNRVIKNRFSAGLYSLQHLTGSAIDINKGNFVVYSTVSRKVINLLAPRRYSKSNFNKAGYSKTIRSFLSEVNSVQLLSTVNLVGIINLLVFLESNNDQELKDLLCCTSENLISKENYLLASFNIQGENEKFVLKLIFNYDFDDIGPVIRNFFRSRNIIHYCPYCNYLPVKFSSTTGGRTVTGHQLDHFFDKASHPILAYSIFNLVPSDSICNTEKKRTIAFSDQYHLNPYTRGFTDQFKFVPIEIAGHVKNIDLRIDALKGSAIRFQMLGNTEEINEDDLGNKEHEQGNINVFTIYSLYKNETDKAEDILEMIRRTDSGLRFNLRFLGKMKTRTNEALYKEWYLSRIKSHFDEDKFHLHRFSKFNRDIHDYYFTRNPKRRNAYIREMIYE